MTLAMSSMTMCTSATACASTTLTFTRGYVRTRRSSTRSSTTSGSSLQTDVPSPLIFHTNCMALHCHVVTGITSAPYLACCSQ
eukprot:3619396-Pleurochrysis_carterae.AAC.1